MAKRACLTQDLRVLPQLAILALQLPGPILLSRRQTLTLVVIPLGSVETRFAMSPRCSQSCERSIRSLFTATNAWPDIRRLSEPLAPVPPVNAESACLSPPSV